ncbi:MAG: PadR family transcriptional regulator [Desulfurococcales archaeon]|nr:PadR family transcriptional regulator [Desulfurococcales archaeon]
MHDSPITPLKIRGAFKYLVLYVLRSKPMHGYSIIQEVSKLFDGKYVPSPGVVYPTLQLLEDMGLVESRIEGRRKVYVITDDGVKELEKNIHVVRELLHYAKEIRTFFQELGGAELVRAISNLIKNFSKLDQDRKQKIREALESLARVINEILEDIGG